MSHMFSHEEWMMMISAVLFLCCLAMFYLSLASTQIRNGKLILLSFAGVWIAAINAGYWWAL